MKKRGIALLLAAGMTLGMLSGCGDTSTSQTAEGAATADSEVEESEAAAAGETEQDAAGAAGETDENAAETDAPQTTDQVASAAEMTTVEDVVEEGMVPVYAAELVDGTYDVKMKSSSSMFKVDRCELVVEDGGMQAVLYMTSQSYLYLYAGTAAEAAAADESDYILREEAADGMGSYTLPVEALDEGISCAAFSRKKEKWYDRTLLFRADSLPQEAFLEARGTSVADLALEDGAYTVDVTLAGGSGRASVESPAALTVSGDTYTVTIAWSSPNYDYMVVDGAQYDPVNTEGNSVFEIPLTSLDTPVAVQADTTAMSQPYLIDYTLTFDSASITPAQ